QETPAPARRPQAAAAQAAAQNTAPVEQDVQRLAMSTLSFQDYVRERLLRRRRAALQPDAPETVMPTFEERAPAAPISNIARPVEPIAQPAPQRAMPAAPAMPAAAMATAMNMQDSAPRAAAMHAPAAAPVAMRSPMVDARDALRLPDAVP